ncbi:uncharacterized protein KD926_004556 [Aspergillus affinis]|uniref:uncharacterized protein n=1 Tax=Aspergillus affinis TaxID=1070780 RepID=UPI0022FE3624|nr:uncharacterized protein KD926_004556 [Aspergillus affinis]KAI9043053.1 hypothetical protein KD926_004556 [Aspergillus affinis]
MFGVIVITHDNSDSLAKQQSSSDSLTPAAQALPGAPHHDNSHNLSTGGCWPLDGLMQKETAGVGVFPKVLATSCPPNTSFSPSGRPVTSGMTTMLQAPGELRRRISGAGNVHEFSGPLPMSGLVDAIP